MNLCLLQLGDSALPIGGYSHSWGLEAAIDRGQVRDAQSLENWTQLWLQHALGPSEGVVVAAVCRAVATGDWSTAAQANDLLWASLTPPTLRHASRDMGEQLLALAEAWDWAAGGVAALRRWSAPSTAPEGRQRGTGAASPSESPGGATETERGISSLSPLRGSDEHGMPHSQGSRPGLPSVAPPGLEGGDSPREWHHAPVFATLAAAAGSTPREAVAVYLHQATLGVIGAGVRAVPVGHTHGQQILARLHPMLDALAGELADRELETAGACGPAYEVLCHAQSQLYTRLFRS